jgi:hypothetical protein
MSPFQTDGTWFHRHWYGDAAPKAHARVRFFAGMVCSLAVAIALGQMGIPRG